MKSLAPLGLVVALVAVFGIKPAFPQTMEEIDHLQWVKYQDGEISLVFAQAPVSLALHAIRARTGFQIDVPSAAENKILNLRVNRLPLEPAVRSLLSSIGFRNFAMMYDEQGRPSRAIALEMKNESTALASDAILAAQKPEPAPEPLTDEEREKLQMQLQSWSELKQEERGRIEDRIKALPPSEEREELLKEYGKQMLGIKS